MHHIAKAYDALLSLCGLAAGLLILGLALATTAEVLLRNLLGISLPWLLELSEYVVYVATFIAAPWVLRQGSHVRVDVFLMSMPPTLARYAELLAEAVGLVISAILMWHGARITIASINRGEMLYKEFVIPEWWLLIVLPLSGALLVIEFCFRIARALSAEAGARPGINPNDGL